MFLSNYKNKISKLSLSKFSFKEYIILLLSLFFFLYSFFSSNVPQKIEFYHYLMVLISLSIFILTLFGSGNIFKLSFLKQNTLFIIFLLVIIYGIYLGFENNNSIKNIARDVISISSIFTIFVTIFLSQKNNSLLRFIFKLLVFTGLIFSIRASLFYYFNLDHSEYREDTLYVAKYYFLYLENTIVCALIYFSIKIFDKVRKKNFSKMILYLVLLYFPLFVVTEYILRGPIFFSFIAILIYTLNTNKLKSMLYPFLFLLCFLNLFFAISMLVLYYFFYNINYRYIQYGLIFFLFIFLIDHIFAYEYMKSDLTHDFAQINSIYLKVTQAGFNNRGTEFIYFLDKIGNNYFDFKALGLGSLVYNPLNESNVLFVHNFSLFYAYKLGLIGFIFSLIFILILIRKTFLISRNFSYQETDDKYIYVCSIGTLLYPLFFSATYKSLTFGFLIAIYLSLNICIDYGKSIK